ncbi:oxidoreductase, aldo/keto reductase family [Aquipluma nitroreducens]|uniref:Oxidoreductase, aldo/keto reductase family n=1 Tax=Aquipluma nitroreducens TaxID=2010828 RepID=A0A5K7S4U2_9BACT|nr:aldo/keto reductase [Aquipluma nitroreducens]BBE16519.1 oxidoreductase, aldo/keto reductase family [Aquipluma nitroreducens]
MEKVKLNNGIEMPVLGFGVMQIMGDECETAVLNAIEAGYRLFDTAELYGNEQAVGNAIKRSGIPREELFIATKFGSKEAGYEKTIAAFQRSLEALQLDYIDLYLIHQPFGDIFGSWRAMQYLYNEGKIKAIGVCNFLPDRLMDLIANSGFIPAVNQIEAHPYQQQIETQQFLQDNGVQIEAWSPFAEGMNDIFNNEVLAAIAAKYNKTVAQVILRWLTQRGVVAIPKSGRKERMIENISIFDFRLSDEDIQRIQTLDTKQSMYFDHRNPAIVKWMSEYGWLNS